MALWGARFHTEADDRLNAFNSSISVDQKMYAQDIKGQHGACDHACCSGHY